MAADLALRSSRYAGYLLQSRPLPSYGPPTAAPQATEEKTGQRNSAKVASNHYAKSQPGKVYGTSFIGINLAGLPTMPTLLFVIMLAIAAFCSMVAVSAFFVLAQKQPKQKTQPLPILCAPARPSRLRACHTFCPVSLLHTGLKKSAKPLRKRTGARPWKNRACLSPARSGQCARGRCLPAGYCYAKAPQSHAGKAYPLCGPTGRFCPSRFCGLPFTGREASQKASPLASPIFGCYAYQVNDEEKLLLGLVKREVMIVSRQLSGEILVLSQGKIVLF